MGSRSSNSRALTLVEVIIALVVLAGALVVLLGLQTASVDRALHERNLKQAMLKAREILAAIEAREGMGEEEIPIGVIEGTVDQVLETILPGTSQVDPNVEAYPFNAVVEVDFWGIPNVNEEAMKKITVETSWGEQPHERTEIIFFIPLDTGELSANEVEDDE